MHDLDLSSRSTDPGFELDGASGIGGGNDRRSGAENVAHFPSEQFRRHFRLGNIIDAGAATAPARLRQFDELEAGNHLQECPRLAADFLSMTKMTALMIGDHELCLRTDRRD